MRLHLMEPHGDERTNKGNGKANGKSKKPTWQAHSARVSAEFSLTTSEYFSVMDFNSAASPPSPPPGVGFEMDLEK